MCSKLKSSSWCLYWSNRRSTGAGRRDVEYTPHHPSQAAACLLALRQDILCTSVCSSAQQELKTLSCLVHRIAVKNLTEICTKGDVSYPASHVCHPGHPTGTYLKPHENNSEKKQPLDLRYPSLQQPILVTSKINYFLFPANILKILFGMAVKDKILVKG